MTSPIQKNGTPLSSIFAPYLTGAKAAATGIYENGNDLANIYAPLSAGSSAAATGITIGSGASLKDLNKVFAAINTTNYPLGFNGQTYTRSRGRGTATITLTMNANGTWNIVNDTGATLASGNWLNFGGSAGNYTVQYVMTGFANGADPGGGSDTYQNDAPSAVALTTSRLAQCAASATVLGSNAANSGTVTVKLYYNGTLVSTSTCTLDTSAAG